MSEPKYSAQPGKMVKVGNFCVRRDYQYLNDELINTFVHVTLPANVWHDQNDFDVLRELPDVLRNFKEIENVVGAYSWVNFSFTKKSYARKSKQIVERAVILAKLKI